MPDYIVTVKLPKDPLHDPNNKKFGACPFSHASNCTDTTGAHHSTLVRNGPSIEQVRAKFDSIGLHVTRIETVDY